MRYTRWKNRAGKMVAQIGSGSHSTTRTPETARKGKTGGQGLHREKTRMDLKLKELEEDSSQMGFSTRREEFSIYVPSSNIRPLHGM